MQTKLLPLTFGAFLTQTTQKGSCPFPAESFFTPFILHGAVLGLNGNIAGILVKCHNLVFLPL